MQIQKLRNIGAPKCNETSGAAPRLLKLTLTDGFSTCQALELEPVTKLDIIKTAPGSKILFKTIQTVGSYILITNSNATLLGGHVPALIERWQLSKLSITKHARGGSDGPPAWVPFGQKVSQPVITDQNFRSLEPGKGKEPTSNEFEAQREEAIAEAAQGAVRKTFGGSSSKTLPPVRENQRFNNKRQSNRGDKPQVDRTTKLDRKKIPKERDSVEVSVKPTGKISLFAFLEDKLPTPDVKVELDNNKQMKPSYAEKYDASLRHKEPVKKNNSKEKVDSKDRSKNEKAPRFQRYQNDIEHITNKANELSFSEPKQLPNNTGYNKPHTNPRQQSGYAPRGGGKYNNRYQGNNYYNDNRNYPKDNFDNQLNYPKDNFDKQPNYPKDNFKKQPNYPKDNFVKQPNYPKDNFDRQPNYPRDNFGKQPNYPKDNLDKQPNYSKDNFDKPLPSSNNNFKQTEQRNYQEKQLNELSLQKKVSTPNQWQWNTGDRCMAKYWEDNQYYNASVTNVTPNTCVVQFSDYGNFEEVLKADCIPVAPSVQPPQQTNNRQYTGNNKLRSPKN